MEKQKRCLKFGTVIIIFGVLFVVSLVSLISLVSLVTASTPGDINSCQILNVSGVYNLTRNLNESDVNLSSSTIGCFNISVSNVSLDCGGFYIRNTSLARSGIYAGDNLVNITISNCNVNMSLSRGGNGIQFNYVNNSFIINNTANSNDYGIYLSSSSNNTLSGNTASSNHDGISLTLNSNNNNLSGNTASSNSLLGIYLSSSLNNTLSGNSATLNDEGIYLSGSSNNTLSGNNMNNNLYNFDISGDSFSHFSNVITADNLVENKKIYYNYSISNYVYDENTAPDAGLVYCPYCNNITIKNLNLSAKNYYGILFYLTNNSIIQNVTADSNYNGIYLSSSLNNTLSGNSANSNSYGIYLSSSLNNTLSGNSANSNSYGIYLSSSLNNTLSGNSANSNSYGISLSSSSNNTLSGNTINSSYRGIYFLSSSLNNTLSGNSANSNVYGIYLSSSSNNTLSGNIVNSNGYGVYLTSSSNNNLSGNIVNSNNYGIYLSSNSKNIFQNTKLNNNLNTNIINISLINEDIERTYQQNLNISFNLSIQYINGTSANKFNYNISVYPNEPSLSIANNSNNLTVTFNATKQGIYSIKLNITLTDTNDSEMRNFIFLVGNTTLGNIKYYMHADEPTHGQPLALNGFDSGSMFSYPTTTQESRNCSIWVQFQPDEIINQFFIIKNISLGWFYRGIVWVPSGIQRYATYNTITDYSLNLTSSDSYVFNTNNFTGLNITSDYAWRFYWLSLKLSAAISPSVVSNSTQQSYADLTYLYAGPQILQFQENNGSDIRNIDLLSNIFNDATQRNATLQFEGNGNFTITLNMTNAIYTIVYDSISCALNSNCTLNSNSNGIVNISLSLGSLHTLDIFADQTAPAVVVQQLSGGGGGIAGYWLKTYDLTKNDLNKGINYSLKERERIKINIISKQHYIGIISTNINSAIVSIGSNPVNVTFVIGEEKRYDLNDDKSYDLWIKLNSITSEKANIGVKQINESFNGKTTGDAINENKSSSNNEKISEISASMIYVIISIVVIIIILFAIIKKIKK